MESVWWEIATFVERSWVVTVMMSHSTGVASWSQETTFSAKPPSATMATNCYVMSVTKRWKMQWVKCHNLPPEWRHSPGRASKTLFVVWCQPEIHLLTFTDASVVKMAKKWFDACISLSFRLTDLTCFGNWLRKQMHQLGLLPNTVRKRGHFATTSISFARTSVQRKNLILLHIIDMITLHTPHLLTSQEFSRHLKTVSLIVVSWGDEFSMLKRVLNLFESCHLGRSFQKMQKSFCNSPILQTTPLPVYIYIYISNIYNHFIWSNFNIYFDFIICIFDGLWIDFDRWAPSWVAYVHVTTVRLFCTWLSSCCGETYAF